MQFFVIGTPNGDLLPAGRLLALPRAPQQKRRVCMLTPLEQFDQLGQEGPQWVETALGGAAAMEWVETDGHGSG